MAGDPPSLEALLGQIRSGIEAEGWRGIGVDGTPPFVYTVGLTETWRHPELILVGLPPETGHRVLSNLVSSVRNALVRFDAGSLPGDLVGTDDGHWLLEVGSEHLAHYLPLALRAQEASIPVRALQVVWPDDDGRLPWDAGFDPRFREAQPLLGAPPS